MKAAIISMGSKSSTMVAEAMEKYFTKVDSLDIRNIEVSIGTKTLEILNNGKPIGDYDCIYAKGSFRFEPILRSMTSALYTETYMPIKPTAFTIGHDKLLTQLDLHTNSIPMPTTYLAASVDAAKKILSKVNYPIIMKLPQGTGGKGVLFADSYASASSILDTLSALKQPFIIQEYVETGGTDLRVLVIGDKIAGTMKRIAGTDEKRANVHSGGSGEAFQIDSYTRKIAVDAAKSLGAEICGVDILEGTKGPMVIEINLSPGIQELTKAAKIDVADKIAKYLYEKAKTRKESTQRKGASKIMADLGVDTGKIGEIITNLDFRGNRILLPESVTNVCKFNGDEEAIIKVEDGVLTVKRFWSQK